MKAKPFSQLPLYTIRLKRWTYCLSGVGKSKKMCLGENSAVVGCRPSKESMQFPVCVIDRHQIILTEGTHACVRRRLGQQALEAIMYQGQVRSVAVSPSPAPLRPRPVNPPPPSGHGSPEEPFVRRLSRMMVENGGAFVESSRVPRIAELEQVVVEVVTELVAQRAQKCAIRCDFFLSRSSHPQPYDHRRGVVVAEQFSHPFAASKRSRFEHPDAALWDLIEARSF